MSLKRVLSSPHNAFVIIRHVQGLEHTNEGSEPNW